MVRQSYDKVSSVKALQHIIHNQYHPAVMKTPLKFLFVGSALILSCATTKAQVIGMINNVAKASAKASAKAAKAATFRPNILTPAVVSTIHASEQLKQIQKQKQHTIKVPKPIVGTRPGLTKRLRIKTDAPKAPSTNPLKSTQHDKRLQEKPKDAEESKVVISMPDETDTTDKGRVADKKEEGKEQ